MLTQMDSLNRIFGFDETSWGEKGYKGEVLKSGEELLQGDIIKEKPGGENDRKKLKTR